MLLKLFLVNLLLLISLSLEAQSNKKDLFSCNYADDVKSTNPCYYLKSNKGLNNKFAEIAVSKILSPLGLPKNFVLIQCPEIKNAAAITSNEGIRYILYDETFIRNIDLSTSSWSSVSILAHEIGHHLCGHTLHLPVSLEERRKRELEADEFSGFVLFKLGASLKQSQMAILTLSNNNNDTYSTHPRLVLRTAAIAKGYKNAQNQIPLNNINHEKSAEFYFSEGDELLTQNQYDAAIEKLDIAIRINPKYVDAYWWRATAKMGLENYSESIADVNKAISLDPSIANLYTLRGLIKYEAQDYSNSILDFNKSIEMGNKDIETLTFRADSKIQIEDYTGALSDCNIIIQLDSKNSKAYSMRGAIYYLLKRYTYSIEEYSKSLDINPYEYITYYYRAESRIELKDYQMAIIDYNKSINLNPKYSEAFFKRGIIKMLLNQKNEGCADLRKAVDLGSDLAKTSLSSFCY